MKKLLFLMVFAGVSFTSFAQNAVPTEQYSVATNSFWSNWFIQVGVDWNVFYADQEHGNNYGRAPWRSFRSNPGASVAIGKWFTPGIGLRTKVQGIWGKTVGLDDNNRNSNKYWLVNEQVMFNLSNMLCGYSETRVWNVIPFAGAGVGRNMTYNRYAIGLSAGIQSSWKLSQKVRIYGEVGLNSMTGDFDGFSVAGNRGWDNADNNVYAEVGLTFNLGSATWAATPDVDAIMTQHQAELDALNAKLNDANSENARLKELLANQKPVQEGPDVAAELAKIPVSVFFNIDKSKIASKKDLVNVKNLADYSKDNNATLVVTGYADSATGPADYNRELSQKRAETVADELVKMGVSRDNIVIEAKGGVNDLSPFSYNRRVLVKLQ